jgi:tetratricopeptide (TPR) repeat protein
MAQVNTSQTKAQLASTYYRNKEFEKAAPIYLELYESTKMLYYFDSYINCLVENKDYEEAEKAIKKQLRKNKNSSLQITLGTIYKEKGEKEKSAEIFDEIIKDIEDNVGAVTSVANNFFNRREFEYAEKAYMKGREIIPGEMFRSNLAYVYAYTRNYSKMMEEYLIMLKEDENQLPNVEGRLNSLLRYDFDNSLRKLVKKEVLKKIQESPENIVYNRLLIWLFVEEKDYTQALNQSIALDKRTKNEELNILGFSKSAAQNNLFDVAIKGLDYLSARKPPVKIIKQVKKEIVSTEYRKFINTPAGLNNQPEVLVDKFKSILSELGYNNETAEFAKDYAHFLSFYLNRTNDALAVIDSILNARDLNNLQRSLIKVEQADINVYDNNLWEATLLYAQIIDSNKDNPIGDEVKMKKALLGFYIGDINWAKAQVDVLKASTSKLIANDAMDLSMLISAYYEMDTIEEPIQIFARGDLLIFQNKEKEAIQTYDSINILYPGHSLTDKILMRKAQIYEKRFDYDSAVSIYQTVIKDFPFSTSADDALYKTAVIYEDKIKDLEKAQELYKLILLNYPGSIFVTDSRNRYRILRGDIIKPEEIPLPDEYEAPAFF